MGSEVSPSPTQNDFQDPSSLSEAFKQFNRSYERRQRLNRGRYNFTKPMNHYSNSAPGEEQFDLNRVELEGSVQRIWERSGSIYFRLEISTQLRIDIKETTSQQMTCRLPSNVTNQQPFSLLPGDWIRVVGFLVDSPYIETLQQFLASARAKDFLSSAPDPAAWQAVQVPRISTLIEVLEVAALPLAKASSINHASVQGVVAKVWERGGNLLARLAMYDEHTHLAGQNGNHNRPRRIPHYVTLLFPEGKVGCRPVDVEAKTRLRATGSLLIRPYRESLREVLLRSRNLALLQELPNSDRVADISAVREAAYVEAQSAILFTRTQPYPKGFSCLPSHSYKAAP